MRDNLQTRGIPVVMLTAANEIPYLAYGIQHLEEYLGKAPFAFLEKPIDPSVLLKPVVNVIVSVWGNRAVQMAVFSKLL